MQTNERDTPGVLGSNEGLGPLPAAADLLQVMWRGDREFARPADDYYTADQMRSYAAQALASERERYEKLRKRLQAVLDAPSETMSDSTAVREMVRQAKLGLKGA